jgi:hypothetical protein
MITLNEYSDENLLELLNFDIEKELKLRGYEYSSDADERTGEGWRK